MAATNILFPIGETKSWATCLLLLSFLLSIWIEWYSPLGEDCPRVMAGGRTRPIIWHAHHSFPPTNKNIWETFANSQPSPNENASPSSSWAKNIYIEKSNIFNKLFCFQIITCNCSTKLLYHKQECFGNESISSSSVVKEERSTLFSSNRTTFSLTLRRNKRFLEATVRDLTSWIFMFL